MITYIFTPANIRLSFENAKRFLEYFFEGLTRISLISRILLRCKQRGILILSLSKNSEGVKIREISGIRAGKFKIPHSALKDSITNLSKLAL